MTALASTAPSPDPAPDSAPTREPAAAPRQTRWLLRLHRSALCVWAGIVVVVSTALLWLWGPLTDAAAAGWRQYDACGTAARCTYDQPAILLYKAVYQYATVAVLAVPFLVAAWAGATLIGRELETGTARLAWTQSVSPARWLANKLAVPAALIAVGTGLPAGLHHLAWSAGRGRIGTAKSWYDPTTFYTGGPTIVALALVGLAAGALAGLAWRRAMPALITSVVATAGVFGILRLALPYLWPGETRVSGLEPGVPAGVGVTVDEGVLTSTGDRLPDPCGIDQLSCDATYDKFDVVSYYRDYHPFSHYWVLQLTSTALALAIGGVLVLVAFRVLKRRTGAAPTRGGGGTPAPGKTPA
ncbi:MULTISPECIES: ABC transporter permease [unclassified Streptomyces]|uniref:ABC transporter permease n=1 Tax=unclassified Streptomyces TaxID=2593676 RepID=UPI002DD9666A|nr:ABC transporter permease [Streptomyces sp. NBC_01795]WSA95196.1 ABC transporter permease [Streptomyces sp. NBC_01795]WSS40894.1 ABC transporter permease [Streptomyces sp. NBC_01187]